MTPAHPKPRPGTQSHVPALAAAKWVVSSWTWLYTMAFPRNERVSRRAEILADLHDHMEQSREEGTGPIKTAQHILARTMLGLLDDVLWAGQQAPSALDECLKRGSDAVGHVRPSPLAIALLAMLGLMNWTLAMSDLAHAWYEWIAVNASVLAVTLLLLRQRHLGVRGPTRAWSTLAAILAIGVVTWIVLGFRLEPVPATPQLMFDVGFMVLLVVSGILVSARICRVQVSWGEWWPVWLGWATVAVAAWGTAGSAGESSSGLGESSLMTALVCVGWMALAATFAVASRAVCYGGLMGSVRCMRLLAAGIRIGAP